MEQLYKQLHMYPETGTREFRTAQTLSAWLTEKGLSVTRVGETGLIALLEGGKGGKTVALRADMDALPLREQTGLPYASRTEGVMHACGHDFHMAALCGAAEKLAAKKKELCGKVLFLFESDEEGDGGAAALAAHPLMQDCSAVFGAHIDPGLPAGVFGFKSGTLYAASATFDIEFIGRSAHGALPEQGADALAAAAESVGRLLSLRKSDRMCSVGVLQSGKVRNIIAPDARLSGIVRAADMHLLQQTEAEMQALLQAVCKPYGVQFTLCYRPGYPGVVNPEEETAFARDTAAAYFGEGRVRKIPFRFTTEDFGALLSGRGGSFYHIGVGGEYGLHSALLAPDPTLLQDTALLHAVIIEKYLSK